MAFHPVVSSILRGYWLIEKNFAESQLPLVAKMLSGDMPNFSEIVQEKSQTDRIYTGYLQNHSVYSVGPGSDLELLPNNSLAIVTISGPLMKNGGMCSYGMADYSRLLGRLGSMENIKGVLLSIDSPGGQAYGTADLAHAIKQLDAKKPVLAVVNDGYAASAAMWIASAARELYTTKRTDKVGSIGVYTTIADFYTHYKEYFKLHVKDVYAPQSTDKNKTVADAIAGDEEGLKEDLSILADEFISTIKVNRGERLTSEEWNTGKMYYSKEAKKLGLIDGTMPFENVIQRLSDLAGVSSGTKVTKSKSNKMAFERTLAAAVATEFAVVEGGFLLTEEQLNSVEQALAVAAGQSAEIETLQNRAAELAGLVASKDNRIAELEAALDQQAGEASGNGTELPIAGDAEAGLKKVRSYNDPNSAINRKADRRLGKK